MERFRFRPTPLTGLTVIERTCIEDSRGFLSRFFCQETMSRLGMKPIQQINHTLTRKAGAIRGMHFQHPPAAEIKIVSCLQGRILDVAVDLRAGSPTFLQWFSAELSRENQYSLFIPEGFAHGFQTLTKNCELLYLHTVNYSPTHEAGLNPLDPLLAITWPLDVSEISARDQAHPMLDSNFKGIEV
ncbi:dTDP-4-dehydrorhamnose 3,5-epimerase family protein [Methylophilus methylotrophus]|uniref:dTDP-4-dehydrorhamnose 3,5-epimerase family protein n=1 Tax=Methylophilus methylotrophus TaxID=17 RepID=UPI000374615B|nr:dTDP-4-dehydrorhamnose 3,5-epimerase family protein [Methylophilus methylotrophus]